MLLLDIIQEMPLSLHIGLLKIFACRCNFMCSVTCTILTCICTFWCHIYDICMDQYIVIIYCNCLCSGSKMYFWSTWLSGRKVSKNGSILQLCRNERCCSESRNSAWVTNYRCVLRDCRSYVLYLMLHFIFLLTQYTPS